MEETIKYEITNQFVKQSIKSVSNSLVGRILSRVQDFAKINKITVDEKEWEMLRVNVRNMLHENLRDLEVLLSSFDKGIKLNLEIKQ